MPLSFLFACSAGCSFLACSGGSFLAYSRGSFLACFPMALRCSAPACSVFPMVLPSGRLLALPELVAVPAFHGLLRRPQASSISATAAPLPAALPDGSLPQCRHPLRHGTPGQQPRHGTSCQQFRYGAPASNKPHPAEKSTPVWLAIWRTWAGFANSQHRDAAFATPDNICAHSSLLQTLSSCSDRRKSVGPSAPIAYATSVSPPDEAVA